MEGKFHDTLPGDIVCRVWPSSVRYKWGLAQSHLTFIVFWLFTSHAAAVCVLRFICFFVGYLRKEPVQPSIMYFNLLATDFFFKF